MNPRRLSGAAIVSPLLLLAGCGRTAPLQDFRYSRSYAGEKKLETRIEFAAGTLELGRAETGNLYEMDLQYDADRYRPIGEYQPDGTVRLGAEGIGRRSYRVGPLRLGRHRTLIQTARIGLNPAPDLSLTLLLGAAHASLELGGLRLSELKLVTGASRTELSFSEPNPGSCRTATVTAGAGEVTLTGVGNSGCAEWEFSGGVGKLTVDLGGGWPADARMEVNLAIGGLTLRPPPDLGVRVTLSGFLAKFDGEGFTKAGDTYTAANYDTAKRKLHVVVNSALGGIRVDSPVPSP